MKVLILAAGYGTRLYPLTENQPKPLLPLNDRTIIDYLIDKILHIDDLTGIIVVTNDRFSGNFEAWAQEKKGTVYVPIKVVNDGTTTPENRLGSIGDIDYVVARERIDEDMLIMGGDNLFDYGLDGYVSFAKEKSPHVVIGLYDIEDKDSAKEFGVVQLDQKRKVISFVEKPSRPQSSLIAMCLYYLPKESISFVTEYISETKKTDKAGDYIDWLSRRKGVYGFQFNGKWYDIGSIEAYDQAQGAFRA